MELLTKDDCFSVPLASGAPCLRAPHRLPLYSQRHSACALGVIVQNTAVRKSFWALENLAIACNVMVSGGLRCTLEMCLRENPEDYMKIMCGTLSWLWE